MKTARAYLSSLRIHGYRSCKNTKFDLDPELTAFIGPNGAGKTNVLQAMRLIRRVVARPIKTEDGEASAHKAILEAEFSVSKKKVGYRTRIQLRAGENNTERAFREDETWNLKEFGLPDKWMKFESIFPTRVGNYYLVDRSLRSPNKFTTDMVLIPRDRKSEYTLPQVSKSARSAIESIQKFRRVIRYYSASRFTNPSLSPTAFEVDEKGELATSYRAGENTHLRFLHDLYLLHRDKPEAYNRYVDIVGKSGVHLIRKIAWKSSRFSTTTSEVQSGGKIIKKRRTRTLIIPTIDVRGDELSFNQLSEGTFRTLALLHYIMQSTASLLLIEEPEVCIHHGLLDSVVAVIKEHARDRQIILSTHSDLVVDMLEPENLRLVRDVRAKGTAVSSISKTMSKKSVIALKKYLQTSGTLGDYWKHSGFE